jgi:hypothetical protein
MDALPFVLMGSIVAGSAAGVALNGLHEVLRAQAAALCVFEPALRRSATGSARHGMGPARIQAVLDSTPATDPGGPVRRRLGWGSVALVLLPLAAGVALAG